MDSRYSIICIALLSLCYTFCNGETLRFKPRLMKAKHVQNFNNKDMIDSDVEMLLMGLLSKASLPGVSHLVYLENKNFEII